MNYQTVFMEHSGLKDATHLQIDVYYNKGGATTQRGFYLSVRPVTKKSGLISYVLSTGCSKFLFGVSRFTAKQLNKAVLMAEEFKNELIAAVIEENRAAG